MCPPAPSRDPDRPRLAFLAWLALTVAACDTSPTPHPGTSDATISADTSAPLDTSRAETGDANELGPDTTPPSPDADPSLDTPDGHDDHDGSDADPDDVGPDPLPTEPATVSPLADGPWRWVIVVGPQTLLASDGDGLAWLVGEDSTPVTGPDPLSTFIPPAAAALDPHEVLLGGAFGLLRLIDGVVTPSPLSDRFADEPVTALSTAAGALWLSTDARLYRWADGELTPIDAAPLTLSRHLIAATANDAAWLAGPSGASLLTLTPPTLTVERPSLTGLSTLALDEAGHLYGLETGKTLHVRSPGATAPTAGDLWREAPLPAPSLVATHPDSQSAWVLYEDDGPQLARGAGVTFARVTGLPPAFAAVRHLAAHADGRLVVATATGLFEVSSSRTVSLPPLPDPLTGPLTVSARASDAAQLTTATATVSTPAGPLPLEATLTGLGADRRATVQLDPLTLPNGPLTLALTVTWSDGESKTTTAAFSVDEPTWTRDVGPFFERQCKNCHSADNGGNFASLHTPDRWSGRMAEILCRVDQHDPNGEAPECETLGFDVATMPPGRAIAAPQVQMLRRWRDAGYRP